MCNQRVIQFVIVGAIACWLSAAERKSVSAAPTSKVEATADQVHLPPHFFVENVYQVPRKTYGSWVALTVDPEGRLIVSAESGGLYRVTLPEKGSRDKLEIEKIDVPLGQAQGLLCAFDSLYVIVNGRSAQGPGLYQVSDSNGDDRYDQVALLKKLNGIGEHGPHGVVLGPDSKSLYIIAGNATEMPECERSLAPKLWATDSILATQNDSRGFGAHLRPPGGWICRTDPTGTQWELVATGFRNAYDLAFNREGELFTFDSDNEWDMGMPWYRPTRVCHAVSGAEFGWRTGTGKWPSHRPDSLPPVVDVGPGSPTGIAFGYGTDFPEKYQDALFLGDWSFGNIYAIHLIPHGSSYRADIEPFASAVPLPITDLTVRPQDGMLYFTTGGRGLESSLYRIGYRQSGSPDKDSSEMPSPHEETARLTKLRRRLESLHQPSNPAEIGAVLETAWPFLSHPDRHIRYAARVILEHQPLAAWKERVLAETDPNAIIQSAIALARTHAQVDPLLLKALCDVLEKVDWSTLREREQIDLVRAYQLALIRLGPPTETLRQTLVKRVDSFFPADSPALNQELCGLLVALRSPHVVSKTLALLAAAGTQQEKIHYMLSLRLPYLEWTDQQRKTYFAWFEEAKAYRGGESFDSFTTQIFDEAIEHFDEATKQKLIPILGDAPGREDSTSETIESRDATSRPIIRKWSVEDLNERLSHTDRRIDLKQGEALFSELGCFRCHRIAGRGGILGPDLTAVGRRFSARDLLEAIIEPSRVISDQYRATIFTLADGKRITGHIADLHRDEWSVITDMSQPRNYTKIAKDQIDDLQPSPVSMMPSGLLDTLTEEEITDLLGYLRYDHTSR
ncbi:c-type cytochrome [Alteromonas mediterranea]|uniref:c-type cytochrome n=1 Tax=Alteromonas mediterranea TaxID=314275 RepID=UPI00029876B3|nr:c-type cytochrome [Alteromonas mediterranea]AFV84111.1 heme-binding protein [Alteromonas mediterranea DE1]